VATTLLELEASMALPRTLTGAWKGLRSNRFRGLSIPVHAPRSSRLTSTVHPLKQQQQQHHHDHHHRWHSTRFRAYFPASAVLAFGLVAAFAGQDVAYAEAPAVNFIRLAEVKQHGKDAERKWIIRGTQVYDITDWIPGHPGGDVVSTDPVDSSLCSLSLLLSCPGFIKD
jgi:hypothetical protein